MRNVVQRVFCGCRVSSFATLPRFFFYYPVRQIFPVSTPPRVPGHHPLWLCTQISPVRSPIRKTVSPLSIHYINKLHVLYANAQEQSSLDKENLILGGYNCVCRCECVVVVSLVWNEFPRSYDVVFSSSVGVRAAPVLVLVTQCCTIAIVIIEWYYVRNM